VFDVTAVARGVGNVTFLPKSVGAEVDFVRPFEGAAVLADRDAGEEGGEDAAVEQFAECVNGMGAVLPGQGGGWRPAPRR
jgi:hypothetical protein